MPESARVEIAISTRQVIVDGWPVLLVTHDASDGAWQFVNGHGDTDQMGSALILEVEEVVALDSSLADLLDLPLGWYAWRESRDDEWKRAPA
jgi:hypothetical protein